MEGYTTVWRHWPSRLVAPSLSVDCVYVLFKVLSVAAGGVVFQVFISRILVPRQPCEHRILVDSVVFPTDPPPWGPRRVCNLCDRVWFHAEIGFPAAQYAPLVPGERSVHVTATAVGVAHTF